MGLWSFITGHDPEEEDRQNLEANEFYQNKLSDADFRREWTNTDFGDQNTIEDMQEVEEDNKWWQWGVRRN